MESGNQASGTGRDNDAQRLERQLVQAVQALKGGRSSIAVSLAAGVVSARPGHPQPLYVMAQACAQARDWMRLRSVAPLIARAEGAVPPALRPVLSMALAGAPDPTLTMVAAALQVGDAATAVAMMRGIPAAAPAADTSLIQALALLMAGRPEAAMLRVRHALALLPGAACGWQLLGTIARGLRHPDAGRAVERACRIAPDDPLACVVLAAVRLDAGRFGAAVSCLRRALVLSPADADSWLNLATALRACGDHAGAAGAYRRLLALRPGHAQAADLAATLFAAGRPDAALEAAKAACRSPAALPRALPVLALALAETGRHRPSMAAARLAVAVSPGMPLCWLALSRACRATGDLNGAAAAARRARRLAPFDRDALVALGVALDGLGRAKAARDCFSHALALTPAEPTILSNLGAAFAADRRAEPALRWLRRAVRLDPGNVEAANNLALACKLSARVAAAGRAVRHAIAHAPADARSWSHLAAVRLAVADVAGAVAAYRRAVVSAPEDHRLHGNLLLCLNYDPDITDDALAAEHRRTPAAVLAASRFARTRQAPLRIGFVSPDLRRHPVGYLLRAVLEPLARRGFATIGYADCPRPDDLTAELEARFTHWRDSTGESDPDLAARIAADGVDILIDLAGHTAGNRLGLFARRAAPVQASWIGYSHTTGLPAMDFVITDADTSPPGTEGWYTERLVRLPRGRFCYGPPDEAPDPGPPPMLATAGVGATFGSFNNLAKVNDEVVAVWSALLQACPGARLLLIWESLGDPVVADGLRRRFAAHGVDPSRLDLRGYAGHAALLRAYGEVDVGLDPFPFCGGLSTLESLWMGVPVVSLAAGRPAGRQGLQMLRAIGRAEWVATEPAGYVAKARSLVADPALLAAERAGLRARMAASSLCDAEGMADQLAEAFHRMWRDTA